MGSGELAGLRAAVERLLAVDADDLSDTEVHELTVGVHRLCSRLAAVRARLTAVWDTRRGWADDGSKTAAARLARECGADPATTGLELRRARALRVLPEVLAGLAEGRLSVDVADLFVRAHTAGAAGLLQRDQRLLVGQVEPMRFAQARRTIGYWRLCADDAAHRRRDQRQTDSRYCTVARTFRAGIHVSGFLPAAAGSGFYDQFRRVEQELFEADRAAARAAHGEQWAQHLGSSRGQRGADTLIELARRAATTPAGGRAPVPLFTVLVGYETFHGMLCELQDGSLLHPAALLPHLADAEVERIVFAGPSRVIDVGARTRLFTGALRRAIQVRDRHCQHPAGCDEPIDRCHIDHRIEYEDGGPTNQANGQLYCPGHNRTKHRTKRQPPHGGPP